MLTKDAKTVLKGGAGLFYDRVPLNIASFPFLPDRTIAMLSPAGAILSTESFVNAVPGGLRNPRSVGWNVELDRQLTSALVVRAGFQERNTARDFVLDPLANVGLLSLSNNGRSFYREFQLTGQYKVRRGTLNASYVRSKAFGNLNDFNQFFGNNGSAVINPDEQGRLPFDAPNRFLAWGQFDAPFKLTVLPVLDVHTGFPYSLINQEREFVGPRDSQRFPRFASLDLQVTRPIKIPFGRERLKARVGFGVFNLLNRFNPRDVQSDIDSDRFDAMFNGVGRIWRGKFVLEFWPCCRHFFALMLIAQDAPDAAALPSADEVVAKMVQHDDERRAALQGYTGVRRYVLENSKHHKEAEMVVRIVYHKDGSKEFEVESCTGWGGARQHVFPRLLEAESEASRPGSPENSRMTPENYSFAMLRVDQVDGRKTYVLEVAPKKQKKYLMRGTIWVDAEDFAIVRMDGEPAKNPSFWIKSVHFGHKYQKLGPFWLAASDNSVSDARIFGPTELRIDYFDYVVNNAVRFKRGCHEGSLENRLRRTASVRNIRRSYESTHPSSRPRNANSIDTRRPSEVLNNLQQYWLDDSRSANKCPLARRDQGHWNRRRVRKGPDRTACDRKPPRLAPPV